MVTSVVIIHIVSIIIHRSLPENSELQELPLCCWTWCYLPAQICASCAQPTGLARVYSNQHIHILAHSSASVLWRNNMCHAYNLVCILLHRNKYSRLKEHFFFFCLDRDKKAPPNLFKFLITHKLDINTCVYQTHRYSSVKSQCQLTRNSDIRVYTQALCLKIL